MEFMVIFSHLDGISNVAQLLSLIVPIDLFAVAQNAPIDLSAVAQNSRIGLFKRFY